MEIIEDGKNYIKLNNGEVIAKNWNNKVIFNYTPSFDYYDFEFNCEFINEIILFVEKILKELKGLQELPQEEIENLRFDIDNLRIIASKNVRESAEECFDRYKKRVQQMQGILEKGEYQEYLRLKTKFEGKEA